MFNNKCSTTRHSCSFRLAGSAILFLFSILSGCVNNNFPDKSSSEYAQTVSLFYSSVARIRVGDERGAEYRLKQATAIVPDEPSLWYNLGLLSARKGDFDNADVYLGKARTQAPESARVFLLSGKVESRRNRVEAAIEYLRRAVELNPSGLKSMFALSQVLAASAEEEHLKEAAAILDGILNLKPSNTLALIRKAEIASENGSIQTLRESVARLTERVDNWSPEAGQQISELQNPETESDTTLTLDLLRRLENHLKRYPAFRRDVRTLEAPDNMVSEAMSQFMLLQMPPIGSAPADTSLTFSLQKLEMPDTTWDWIGVPVLTDDGYPVTIVADGGQVHIDPDIVIPFPGGAEETPPSEYGVIPVDYNYDFLVDIVAVGSGGLTFFRQTDSGSFDDVTRTLGLGRSVVAGDYWGGWAADLDSEGDMDLVLATTDGPSVVLRNNGNGTFESVSLFRAVRGVRDFVRVDTDADGDLDPFILDASGRVFLYENEGTLSFRMLNMQIELPPVLAMTVADIDYDGTMDLLLLLEDGRLVRVDANSAGSSWSMNEVLRARDLIPDPVEEGRTRIITGDMDNNGTLDIVVSGGYRTGVWLRDTGGDLKRVDLQNGIRIFEAMDLIGVGRLDFVGITAEGQPVQWMNMADNKYLSTTLRPRTAEVTGDRRINAFGIGGEVEILSGLHFQTRTITGPVVHFGLGTQNLVDAVRIRWPNGTSLAQFDVESDQAILAREGLNSSCPWIFSFDGEKMSFVSDFMMRSPLGLRSNADDIVEVASAKDRIIIRGDQLVEKNGYYSLSVAAELWETLYIDRISLIAVDHPAATNVVLNEFYSIPAPSLEPGLTGRKNPISEAWDQNGRDVTQIVSFRDERYLEGFEIGTHLSQAKDHYVEVDLGESAPMSGPLWLVVTGWLRATDSSVNISISQAENPEKGELWLEVQDEAGAWSRTGTDIGLPYGMFKTSQIDLTDLSGESRSQRIRLRTNQEIYWDQITWTIPQPKKQIRRNSMSSYSAELRYRGFSRVSTTDRAHPEIPEYDEIVSTGPTWHELSGYYTRYGDVRPLLEGADDRYVIMNPGDELKLQFTSPGPPPSGWVRDYILDGVGWTKDGDFNTRFSKSVLPLPDRTRALYADPPGRLEEDPVYLKHPEDWQTFHTRYISGEGFTGILAPKE
jgi:tetratricopeptide (TPR) repeat protein